MTETETKVVTRRDLIERGIEALDRNRADVTKITGAAGGVSFASALEVMDFAKLMSTADKAIPKHLRGNPGACLRIVFQAIEWRMSPWGVADKSYEVNDRIAYESQLLHAIIESRAPLQHRLDCRYEGEGASRKCFVIGNFTDGQTREYESPVLSKIKKHSPLWNDDPDQQLFYFASRAWARKWCPDVLLGIYSREELIENPRLGLDDEPTQPGLHTRLAGAPKSDEGHRAGFAATELDNLAVNGGKIIEAEAESVSEATEAKAETDKPVKGRKNKADIDSPPKTPAEYVEYATAWIKATPSAAERAKRFKAEMKMRNDLGVTSDDRAPLDTILAEMNAAEFDRAG